MVVVLMVVASAVAVAMAAVLLLQSFKRGYKELHLVVVEARSCFDYGDRLIS